MNGLVLLEAAAEPTGGLFQGVFGIMYFVILIGLMWFFLIRPQRKREKQIQQMQDSVKVGDSVMTTGGIFGKVVDIVNNIYVVEFGLNKGVRIPLQKNYIAAVKEPDMTIKKEEEEPKKEETKKDDNKKEKSSKK